MLTRTRLLADRLWSLSPKLILNRLALACVIAVFICSAASAQIKFVQITDPHFYDDGQEGIENKRAFIACLTKIDKLIESGGDYKFVVVTGDIGLERLIKPSYDKRQGIETDLKKGTLDQKQAAEKREEINRAIELKIEGAALEVANMIGRSKVKVWLFVPGNNDLVDEKTDTIEYYQNFVKQLREGLPGKEVPDLFSSDLAKSVYAPDGGFVFIGFDDASFKNNNDAKLISGGTNTAAIVSRTDPSRCEKLSTTENMEATTDASNTEKLPITQTTAEQLDDVQEVIARLDLHKGRPAYIFYHIPEIDDPHPILNFDLNLLNGRRLKRSDKYAYSSWFVDGCVRARWAKVVANNDVKGLFAGHLHDWRQETYENFRWMVTPDYPGGTLNKLHVCPPLAIKRQEDQPKQARGFQTVSIDGTGKVAVSVFWYDAASGTFGGSGETQVGSISGAWRILSSLAGYLWGTIPSYLPFYLLVVVCGYAAIKGLRRATVISPFHLPSDNNLPFGERTVANVLQDALVGARKDAVTGIAERSGQVIGVGPKGMTGLKLPEVRHFEVPIQFAVEVKGLSHEALVSLARKVLRRERSISGDVIVLGKEFQLRARSREKGPWTVEPNQATPEGLQRACRQLALNMLEDFSPTLLAAHDIAEGRFEVAYQRLKELIYAD